jgi:hypothetical protein
MSAIREALEELERVASFHARFKDKHSDLARALVKARTALCTPEEERERLNRAVYFALDSMFIFVGQQSGRHDYRLHPMFAKDMGQVRDRLVNILIDYKEPQHAENTAA